MFSSCFRWNIRWKTALFHLIFHVIDLKQVEEKVEPVFDHAKEKGCRMTSLIKVYFEC